MTILVSAAAGTVRIQYNIILKTIPKFTASIPRATPTPITPPTAAWVVDTGNPIFEATRTVVAAANLWFTMKKQWTPPLKWWTPHVKNMGMSDEMYKLFCAALDDPKFENIIPLFQKLKQNILDDGYDFPDDFMNTFLETIHVKGRPAQIRHTYI